MGLLDTLFESVVKVVAGLVGFGMFIGGAQYGALGNNQTIGIVFFLIGIVLIVFAARL